MTKQIRVVTLAREIARMIIHDKVNDEFMIAYITTMNELISRVGAKSADDLVRAQIDNIKANS